VILNLFPYNNGHCMVVPYRHVANLEDLTPHESTESLQLVQLVIRAMRETLNPGGFNVGLNLGSAAGAGIAPHLHWHVVPRWDGDTNFMPVLADIKVMPQHLEHTYDILQSALETHIQKAGI
jgi:ATP adenylyltransferase